MCKTLVTIFCIALFPASAFADTTINSDITASTTWSTSGGTYVVDGVINVASGVTLTVAPGAVLKFKPSSSIIVNGTLVADSAASSSKIYFTSFRDDTVGGYTNEGWDSLLPAAGDWGGIKVNAGGSATLNYAVARFAGGNTGTTIWNNGGGIQLYNTEVATGTTYGIYESSGNTSAIASNIHHHSVGIDVLNGATASIGSSWIHDNSSYGLYSTAATSSVDAIYNYWGSSSGPYHSRYNPAGTGDKVSDFVNFTPILTELHYLFVENGQVVTAVDSSKDIDWGGTSAYMSAWYGSVDLWNGLGNVTIATSTIIPPTFEDITISDVDSGADSFVAAYIYHFAASDDLKFNNYYMSTYNHDWQLNATAHELGHALGLYHSYVGNMMNSFVTGTTTLGKQDIFDYQYCWLNNNCP